MNVIKILKIINLILIKDKIINNLIYYMADRLARVFGTEEDKVNCSFFFKIGACRHGEKCTRLHYKPP